jgi:DNA-nicking Smr family endonuclease
VELKRTGDVRREDRPRQENATPFASCRPRRDDNTGVPEPGVMSNQLKDRSEQCSDRSPEHEYFVIRVGHMGYAVSGATAAEVMRLISRRWPPRWIGFVDLHGARVRIRSRLITMIHESTAIHRQRERDFERARTEEEKADGRLWEDDD